MGVIFSGGLESCDKYCRDYMTFELLQDGTECIRFIEKSLSPMDTVLLDDVIEEEES
ncbi:MAG: hypothetical protein ACLTK0_10305 [Anaerovoracaceae bacterium]